MHHISARHLLHFILQGIFGCVGRSSGVGFEALLLLQPGDFLRLGMCGLALGSQGKEIVQWKNIGKLVKTWKTGKN